MPLNKKKQAKHLYSFKYFKELYGFKPDIGIMVRVYANGPEDLGSIPVQVLLKTQKMVLEASLLNTQHYKEQIKGKEE